MKTLNEVKELIGTFRNNTDTWHALYLLIYNNEISFVTFEKALEFYQIKGVF